MQDKQNRNSTLKVKFMGNLDDIIYNKTLINILRKITIIMQLFFLI